MFKDGVFEYAPQKDREPDPVYGSTCVRRGIADRMEDPPEKSEPHQG